ncbi:DNA mismatch repair protein MutT [Anaerobacillus alkalidiazotrophicus]|uniref:8-oxo-dGTP diphosphatase n=1 Tax=Anaerobacillus alkalidiazotrophicus TaxID=472963 RepID=A0A1S2MF59_9BACI|nr:(deoxy)nucleoside triphosphate pyrophosphohydrolase [Anaerobacillus alkalidiazotrophicus]OIJ22487.1 DNA mismatch repair protein MutT [Anaerobacillus alkalidiazotrophicus]
MIRSVNVVGAVIENHNGQFLCALRSSKMSMPNLWEFPGGKIKEGEKPETALIREIVEELGCTVKVGELVASVEHQYPEIKVNLKTFRAIIQNGQPKALEHSELRWVPKDELEKLNWAPADIPTVNKLKGS